jgi:opacity protein-like surface antigen
VASLHDVRQRTSAGGERFVTPAQVALSRHCGQPHSVGGYYLKSSKKLPLLLGSNSRSRRGLLTSPTNVGDSAECSMNPKLPTKLAMTALLLAVGTTAQAADLPAGYVKAPPLLFDWAGFYLGGNVGGAFSEEKAAMPLGSWSPNPGGVLGGIQLGYNFPAASNWLIGIEGELDWTSAQGTVVIPNPVAAATITSNHNSYDTFEGRFGFFQGPWLSYFKGGAAWLNADYRLTGNFNGVPTLQSITNSRSGWTVGAGIEYMWAPNWSAKVEYDYLDFGTQNMGFGALGTTIGINTNVHEFKVGFNYHWLPGTLFGGF